MVKSVFYIQCTVINDFSFGSGYQDDEVTELHRGDVVYYNKNGRSRGMHLRGNMFRNNPYRCIGEVSFLPFTMEKKWAKKWQGKKYADRVANIINSKGHFNAEVKEIKITYDEEEV